MKTVSAYFGDQHPDEIREGGSSFGYQLFTLYWQTSDTLAMGITYCPLEMSGGAMKMKRRLRDCYVKSAFITKLQTAPQRAGTVSNAEY